MAQSSFNWEFEIPTWERKETVRRLLEKCRKDGVSAERAMKILARHGFERRLVERFTAEISEGQL